MTNPSKSLVFPCQIFAQAWLQIPFIIFDNVLIRWYRKNDKHCIQFWLVHSWICHSWKLGYHYLDWRFVFEWYWKVWWPWWANLALLWAGPWSKNKCSAKYHFVPYWGFGRTFAHTYVILNSSCKIYPISWLVFTMCSIALMLRRWSSYPNSLVFWTFLSVLVLIGQLGRTSSSTPRNMFLPTRAPEILFSPKPPV